MRNGLPIFQDTNWVLEAKRLGYKYSENRVSDKETDNGVELFGNLSFSLAPGDVRVILGPSGSGKTTLLHLLAGLLRLQAGEVLWNGEPIGGLSEEALAKGRLTFTGLIFQHHYLQTELTALENVLIPGYLANAVDPVWGQELLSKVGLVNRANLLPKALSGGERQRVAVARALYNRPKLLLADEPTGSLDRRNAERVMELMLGLARELGVAVIIATHDEHLTKGLAELRLGQ